MFILSLQLNKIKIKKTYVLAIIIITLIAIPLIDLIRITNYKCFSSLPQNKTKNFAYKIYYDLVNNSQNIDWKLLDNDLEYIKQQYDVSDFYIATIIRILSDYPSEIPYEKKEQIKKTLLGFRYWMDEPGENGMCYWSENHQILFASAEYLVGQMYPSEIFTNDGLTGSEHKVKARKRILDWLEMRWKFGFTEFYSNVYYNEDIAGMINIIDYADDETLVKKAEIIMDLLLYDIASQKTGNMFVTVSGRAYERNRKGGDKISSKRITDYLWQNKLPLTPHINFCLMTSKKYKVPQVIIEIGNDKSSVVIKQSNGLNINQLREEGYFGPDEKSIMMQWGMEAFVNPAIIGNTMKYIRKNNMFSNEFLNPIKYFDFTFLRLFSLEGALSRIVNPQENGAAIQKANTYTFKTKDYSVYSVQNYFPGNFADQVHVAGMNIDSSFSVFHSHPAITKNTKNQSPNYWVGYGRLPHVAQDSSVSLAIYNLPSGKAAMELDMLNYTHAYFPKEKFDTVIINRNYIFGKKENTYCALIGKNSLYFAKNSTDDIIQNGRETYWIIEAGNKEKYGSFEKFREKIINKKISFDSTNLLLTYTSIGKKLKLQYCGDFTVNGSKVNTNYPRYDSPYIKAKFKPDSLEFKFNNKHLNLNFSKSERIFN